MEPVKKQVLFWQRTSKSEVLLALSTQLHRRTVTGTTPCSPSTDRADRASENSKTYFT